MGLWNDNRYMIKWAAVLLCCVVLLTGCAAGGKTDSASDASGKGSSASADRYTYNTSVDQLCTNWNPHTYMTANDSYPHEFVTSSLYSLIFNDALHPLEGKEPYEGYVIVPEMAAADPIDITKEVRTKHPVFGIPSSADSGYAFRIKLRDDLCWDDGTPIDANTFVESLKRLLDPKLLNYRASDVYKGTYSIANSEKFANAGVGVFTSFADLNTTYEAYIAEGHTDDEVFVDISGIWNITTADNKTYAAITDDTKIRDEAVEEGQPGDYISAKEIWDTYLNAGMIDGPETYTGIVEYKYEADYPFENVGLYAEDDLTLVFVFNSALDGFYLTSALSTSWLVKPELYDACLKETKTASGSVWSSTYCTSKDTSVSYGPYKIASYQMDKSIRFTRNDKWYGYHDGRHVYVDPVDEKQYDMYQTTDIDCQVIADTTTTKQMFFAGKLAAYGLQAEDYDRYRNSEYCYQTPGSTVYFAIINGFADVIKKREEAADFDKKTKDLETITLPVFREACAVTFDKSAFVQNVMPRCKEGFGLIGSTYIYDPDECLYYRQTDIARKTLCDFYSVKADEYSSLESAEESITGYDPVKAAELFQKTYEEALEKGFITDLDGDGHSDQTVTLTYSVAADTDHQTRIIDYLNESFKEATAGSGFDGKIQVIKSAPLGNDWSNSLRNGLTDIVLAGWSGSRLDPFNLTDLYVDSSRAFDGMWFDAASHDMMLDIDGEEVTMNLKQWSDSLNGQTVTVSGKEYNFGYGKADVDTRLAILAGFENAILATGDYSPLANDGSMYLATQKTYDVTDDYNPILGYGDLSYTRYNYNDKEWEQYVKSQGGILQY
ncbi:MAG: hypothetical protein IJT32_04620 [Lachnospiraceae bacterium]|nr:hypothetical protein [Lachnospiraceae bacterium]